MKKKHLIILSILIVSGCSPTEKATVNTNIKTLGMGAHGRDTLTYVTVIVDGNEYYACATYGPNWVLCPKLPPKVEHPISNE